MPPWGFWFQKYVQILLLPPVRHGVRLQLLSIEYDRRILLLTIIIRCVDNTCGTTLKSNESRASFFNSGDTLVKLENIGQSQLYIF